MHIFRQCTPISQRFRNRRLRVNKLTRSRNKYRALDFFAKRFDGPIDFKRQLRNTIAISRQRHIDENDIRRAAKRGRIGRT